MKDIKSVMIGFLLATSMFLFMGQTKTTNSEIGRYQVTIDGVLMEVPKGLYETIIDTKTGDIVSRKWHKIKDYDGR